MYVPDPDRSEIGPEHKQRIAAMAFIFRFGTLALSLMDDAKLTSANDISRHREDAPRHLHDRPAEGNLRRTSRPPSRAWCADERREVDKLRPLRALLRRFRSRIAGRVVATDGRHRTANGARDRAHTACDLEALGLGLRPLRASHVHVGARGRRLRRRRRHRVPGPLSCTPPPPSAAACSRASPASPRPSAHYSGCSSWSAGRGGTRC